MNSFLFSLCFWFKWFLRKLNENRSKFDLFVELEINLESLKYYLTCCHSMWTSMKEMKRNVENKNNYLTIEWLLIRLECIYHLWHGSEFA